MKQQAIIMFLCLLLSLTTSTTFAADADGNYAVWGVGKKSCFTYMQARKKDDYADYTNYIKGFLTAYNMMEKNTYSITALKPFNEILDWLDEECELKQINPLEQALLELIDANFDKRMKTPKASKGR